MMQRPRQETQSSNVVNVLDKKQRRDRIPFRIINSVGLWELLRHFIGQDLARVSLPITFCEPLSMLQRLTEDFEYSELLDRAKLCKNSCEQLAYVAAFTVSSYSSTDNRTSKPFNPLLGETFECDRLDDLGWRCISEQVSHHPPIAAQCCEGRGWKCWQEFTMESELKANYIRVVPHGVTHLLFLDSGNHYTWRKVNTNVNSVVIGKLWVDQEGETEIVNHRTGEKCTLKYYTYSWFRKESERINGNVYDSNGKLRYALNGYWAGKFEMRPVTKETIKSKKTIYEYGPAKALWQKNPSLSYSDKCYNFSLLSCQLNEPEIGVAPTDSRLRPDQRLMEQLDFENAESEKTRLETKQRAVLAQYKEMEPNPKKIVKPTRADPALPNYKPTWFTRKSDPQTGETIHVYNGNYWPCKQTQDWSNCRDIFGK